MTDPNPRVRAVTGCGDCPLFGNAERYHGCNVDGAIVTATHYMADTAPDECPLRVGPITVASVLSIENAKERAPCDDDWHAWIFHGHKSSCPKCGVFARPEDGGS